MTIEPAPALRVVPAAEAETIRQAGAALRQGLLVGVPTETVYGLAGDATSAQAVARIYAAKGRPNFNPLIVHVGSLAEADRHGSFSPALLKLAERFWPGPLTLVMPVKLESPVAELARAGLPTIALRLPSHPVMRAIITEAGLPLAAPSANRSGHVTATQAAHVAEDLGEALALIVDAGPSALGLESTILGEFDGVVTLLRAGALVREDIEDAVRQKLVVADHRADRPLSPGMLASHYAPSARLRLEAEEPEAGEAYLAFGRLPPNLPASTFCLNLSPQGDMVEAAANLFSHLRSLDARGPQAIAVAPIPHHGLGEAINDRLARAARGR